MTNSIEEKSYSALNTYGGELLFIGTIGTYSIPSDPLRFAVLLFLIFVFANRVYNESNLLAEQDPEFQKRREFNKVMYKGGLFSLFQLWKSDPKATTLFLIKLLKNTPLYWGSMLFFFVQLYSTMNSIKIPFLQ